jgi:hypothetical protein
MSWDPTDYKDMLDDDWNDIYEKVKEIVGQQYHDVWETASDICAALRRNDILEDLVNWFYTKVETSDMAASEVANEIMEKYYLTPVARKRLRMKNENKLEDMRAKTVSEDYKDIPPREESTFQPPDYDEHGKRYLSDDDDDNDDENMGEYEQEDIAELSSQLEELFQSAANKGMPFEVLQDLIEQALDQVDWVEAGQM